VTRIVPRVEMDSWKLPWAGLLGVIALSACADSGQVLLVHSPLDSEALEWLEQGYEAHRPDIDVRWIQIPPEETLRLLREGPREEWPDVWLGAPAWYLAAAAGEERLATASPDWARDLGSDVRDSAGRWFGVLLDPLVIAFDRDQVSLSQAPRDWIDLFHPRWAGDVVVPDAPGTVAGSLLVGAPMARDVLQGGDGTGGLDWLRRLDATVGEYNGDEADAAGRLARGQGTFAVLRLSTVVDAMDRDERLAWRVPESGTPVLVEGVARVAGSGAGPTGELLLEWVGTPEVMRELAYRLRRLPVLPVRDDAPAPAYAAQARTGLRAWPTDSDTLAAYLEPWVERWRSDVRGTAPRIY
jgi:iron(III) transport system substrate-binding protein